MVDFTSLVEGWPFADIADLRRRIELAEYYASCHVMSDRQRRVLEAMKKAVAERQEDD